MTRTRTSVKVGALCLGLAVVVVSWRVWPERTVRSWATPEGAVTETCHAAKILANYTPDRQTNIRVGWQRAGQPVGVGWAALVVRVGHEFRVKQCQYLSVSHG